MKSIIFNLIIYFTLALLTACGGGSPPVLDDITDDTVIEEVVETEPSECSVVEEENEFEGCIEFRRKFKKNGKSVILLICE